MEKETPKKDILQLEKRVIDMELLATELKETAKDLSLIPEFKQRLDDVEDLVMVENAGIIELKGMLEKLVPPEIKLPENLDERLKTIEEKVQSLPDFSELETRIKSSIPTGFPELENRIKSLEEKLTATQDFSQMENKIRDSILTQLPDLVQLENKIKDSISTILPDLQKIKDDVNKRLEDIESKRQNIEKLAAEIDERLKVSVKDRVERELERIRDNWLAYSEKVNNVEKFVKDFSKKVDEIEPTLKKLDSFERILDLDKKTSEKLQEFSSVTENLEKLAERSTVAFSEIDKRTQKLDVLEKELPSVQKRLSSVSEDLEKMRVEVVKKEEVTPLVTNFKLIADDYKSLVEDLSKRTGNLQIGLNKNLNEMELRIKEIAKPLSAKIGELEGDLSSIVNKESSLEKRIDDTYKAIPSIVGSQIQNVNKKLETLENRFREIRLEDVQKVLGNINSKITEIENRIGLFESKYKQVEEVRREIARPMPIFFDEQLKDLINRMVFLESRLVAIEGSMQKASMALPIVIE